MRVRQNIQNFGSDKNPVSTDELLMAYLDGKLSPEEQRLFEEIISEEGPDADAIEGLQMLHPTDSKRVVAELNQKLHKEILKAKNKRRGRFKDDFWGWIAVVIILLLVLVAYVVVSIASQ